MLSDEQCEEIVMTAFELLERTGADVMNEKALSLLKEAGCFVKGNRVRIPSSKLEWALRVAPSRLTLCDRNGNRAILMETDNVHYGPSFGSSLTYDANSGEIKKVVKSDVENIAKICSHLKNIDFLMDNGTPTDVPESVAELHSFDALVNNSVKPILQPVKNKVQAEAVIEMAIEVKGSLEELQADPFVVLYVGANEPLLHSDDALGALIVAAEHGVPVAYANNLISGLTAPEETAGVLVVALANSLVGILVAQLAKESTPVLTGGFFTINDTDNEMIPYGAPEISLMGAGYSNVLRYLNVPSLGFAGATDSKISDAQMGLESAFSVLHAGLSGTNMIYGSGQMESANISSPFLVVIADEVMGMTKRMMNGVTVNEDTLSRGVIDEVQPGGHYLGEPHTMQYFKSERFWPELMNRNRIDDWTAAGAKTLGTRVLEKTQAFLNNPKSEKLAQEVSDKLSKIIEVAESKLK